MKDGGSIGSAGVSATGVSGSWSGTTATGFGVTSPRTVNDELL